MTNPFHPGALFAPHDLEMRQLEGPPPDGFDCGEEAQNRFLYERAWRDMCRGITVTHVLYSKGILAAYVTLMTDRIKLGPREKPRGVVYQLVPAAKIAQLAVHRRFARCGLGTLLVGYAIEIARMFRGNVGCRYVTLDAASEELVVWYEKQGFVRNKEEQALRRAAAEERGADPFHLPISMRFDLRDAREPSA